RATSPRRGKGSPARGARARAHHARAGCGARPRRRRGTRDIGAASRGRRCARSTSISKSTWMRATPARFIGRTSPATASSRSFRAHDMNVELLLGKQVIDAAGESVGHIEELLAEDESGELVVVEFHTGIRGVAERLAATRALMPLSRTLRS